MTPAAPNRPVTLETLDALLQHQRSAALATPFPSWQERAGHLSALRAMLLKHRDALAATLHADFGNRAPEEILLAEFLLLKEEIDRVLRLGKRWMKPQRRRTSKWLRPARAQVVPQPLGVIGIIVPWNYPVLLAASPLISALAAGNRALIKMPELTPRTSALFASLIAQTFAADHVAVVNGDAAVAAAFSALPFDHLLFTGSTRVGREVMRAAAQHLTPLTLELGGKSPVIIGPGARFNYAVDSLLAGKTLNAGQTCVAPDYVLLPRGTEAAFIARARQRFAQMYPGFAQNPDYTSLIAPRHFARLQQLADEAVAAGAQLHPLDPAAADPLTRRFTPCVVTGAPESTALMQEEIFGPLLPLVPYDTLDDALAWINARPRPLALYLYDDDAATIARVTHETVAGGMAINETLMHLACESLPFGGAGASGMGAYHGYEGFVRFSQMKPVLTQARWNGRWLIAPPYGKRVRALLRFMLRF
ncbi:coniferyl aldehyde dehydrogenase [Paraburkholderia bonniea]|uniref:coniferyl aldehyde dehydrogenase n=1 Tax=Paraburkholderia bonniea TaxID=2152891 RepID=UPI001290DFC4|nr:coniferyl aldehyde dehydrogenase [Paraburkholderia bonniea]WJF90478.1 coniferyl aldehyde dehydrogenase [Paraburkholderia bonniea]WJF93793.1 coniferyl aldehyde dehydrogenase [Paraburkholderia bonniea]